MKRIFPALVCTLLFSACSSPRLAPPPAAPADSYTGSYLGSAADNIGRADVEMVLVQADDGLSGEVLLTFVVGLARYTAAGDVTGSVDAEAVRLRLTPDDPDYCAYQARVTRVGAKFVGSYTGVGCVGDITGTLTLEKQ